MRWNSFRRAVVAAGRRARLSLVAIAATLALLAGTAWADGAGLLAHHESACYCHCAVSKARGGCVKMCEMPKYASRWWATSCARPKSKVSNNSSKTGPRFPRPGRAERAAVDGAQVGESR